MHPYRLVCIPGPANPVKYKDFEAFYLLKFCKVSKTIGFYNISSLPDPQDEAKMGSKMSSKMGSKMGSPRGPKVAIPFEREAKIHEPVLARGREARLL